MFSKRNQWLRIGRQQKVFFKRTVANGLELVVNRECLLSVANGLEIGRPQKVFTERN